VPIPGCIPFIVLLVLVVNKISSFKKKPRPILFYCFTLYETYTYSYILIRDPIYIHINTETYIYTHINTKHNFCIFYGNL
jgi:hypothetical protein